MNIKNLWTKIKSLFGSTSNELKALQTALAYIEPLVQLIATLAGANSEEVASIIAKINSSIAEAQTLSASASNVSSIKTLLTSINTNLASLLALSQIKNSTKVSTITAYVTAITSTINNVIGG